MSGWRDGGSFGGPRPRTAPHPAHNIYTPRDDDDFICQTTNAASIFQALRSRLGDSVSPEILMKLVEAQLTANIGKLQHQQQASKSSGFALSPQTDKQLASMTKLTYDNYDSWSIELRNILEPERIASEYLFGNLIEGRHGYQAEIDVQLAGIVRMTCDRQGPRNVRRLIDGKFNCGGRMLIDHLKKRFCNPSDDPSAMLASLKLNRDANIDDLVFEMECIEHHGWLLGKPLTTWDKTSLLSQFCHVKAQGQTGRQREAWLKAAVQVTNERPARMIEILQHMPQDG